MKKSFIIITFLILAAGLYLYLANAYAYYLFNRVSLKNPPAQDSYVFNAAGEVLNYVALGDSLTSGMGLNKYEESFSYLLADDLAGRGSKVILRNFSSPGYRADDLIKNLLEPAIAAKPRLVTLLVGVNDIHGFSGSEKFKKNYQFILERLSRETKAKIYAISLPFIGAGAFLPPNNYYFSRQTVEFNKIIKESAAAYGAEYIDIAEPTRALFIKNSAYYAADGFHPSAAGQALWEKIIFDAIIKQGK